MPYKFVARPGSPTSGPQRDLTDEEAEHFRVTDSPAYEYVASLTTATGDTVTTTDTTTTETLDPLPETEEE